MAKKHWIYIKRGLSEDPKHRAQMGECVWLYMHIIDRADWEMGIAYDWKDKEEAADMSMPLDTLRSQRQKLQDLDYIRCKQKQHSQDILIMEWKNPRDYGSETKNPRSQGGIEQPPSDFQGGNQGSTQGGNQVPSQVKTPSLNSESESKSKTTSPRLSIENKIFLGLPITQDDLTPEQIAKEAKDSFEQIFGFGTLPWSSSRDWEKLEKFIIDIYKENPGSFAQYVFWMNGDGKYGKAITPAQIRKNPLQFIDTGWPQFLKNNQQPTTPQTSTIPLKEFEKNWKPRR